MPSRLAQLLPLPTFLYIYPPEPLLIHPQPAIPINASLSLLPHPQSQATRRWLATCCASFCCHGLPFAGPGSGFRSGSGSGCEFASNSDSCVFYLFAMFFLLCFFFTIFFSFFLLPHDDVPTF